MSNAKHQRLGKILIGLPGIEMLFQYAAPALVLAALAYLFVTQELLA